MTADEIFDKAAVDIFNAGGTLSTFTPSVGAAVDCYVDLLHEVEFEPVGIDAQVWGNVKTIEAVLAVIGKEPDTNETFTVPKGGTVYTVQTVIKNDGRFVTVTVK